MRIEWLTLLRLLVIEMTMHPEWVPHWSFLIAKSQHFDLKNKIFMVRSAMPLG
jgi:hypothetical protein